MDNRLFKTARVAALASLLCAQGPLVLGGQAPPEAAGDQEFAALIGKLWQEAWDGEFVLNQSGMIAKERAPGVLDIQAHDGTHVIAQGTYYEVLHLQEPQMGGLPELAGTSDILAVDHAVTAGVLVGSTGSISAVFGLIVTTAVQGPSERLAVDTIVPVGRARDAQAAVQGALDLHARLGGASPVLAGDDDDDLTLDPCRCNEKYENDLLGCRFSYISCQATCFAAAVIAIAACTLLGPFAPLCQSAAITAYVACLAACLASEAACTRAAANRFIDCTVYCPVPQGHDYRR